MSFDGVMVAGVGVNSITVVGTASVLGWGVRVSVDVLI